MAKNRINNVNWKYLFKEYKILDKVENDGLYEISSNDINKFRQARLMTKFDFSSQRPSIFKENKLSILPISRGRYVISKIETFCEFETNSPQPIKIEFPNYLESINHNNITSESTALNCAFVSGMIRMFTQDEELKLTISGRMSSSSFGFKINSMNSKMDINVKNSQIEIDGGYEGEKYLSLIEAKNSISDDFMIRQLYYPYRLWSSKIRKLVRPIFLTYSNGIFHFREYKFEDPKYYNSIVMVKEEKYIIRDSTINIETIKNILNTVDIKPESKSVPFPQADSFDRIINLCELLYENNILTKEFITSNYDFDSRQTNYYTDAGRYLGLIDKKKENGEIAYYLTAKGNSMFDLNIYERQIEYISIILSYTVFNQALELYFNNLERPSPVSVVTIMQKSNLSNIKSLSTFERRSSTVLKWVDWIIDQIEE